MDQIDKGGPRWSICGEYWLHVGDEIAVLSELTARHPDAYGRIIGMDADTGRPVVLLIVQGRPLHQAVLPLSDILGRRVQARPSTFTVEIETSHGVHALPASVGGGPEDRTWSARVADSRGAGGWL